MPRKLILIRHAKSAWDDPFADDHARVLNERGRVSAKAVGEWLQAEGHVPNQILSSDAARTTETVDLLVPQMTNRPAVTYVPKMYLASAATLLDTLRSQGTGETVALVAHNPGIGDLALSIVADRPTHERYFDYPTCATAVISFAGADWSGTLPGSGTFVDFAVPRELLA